MSAVAYVLAPPTESVASEAVASAGLECQRFGEPNALIHALYQQRPTLVCVDTLDSSTDAYELVRRIRPRAPEVPMLVLTSPEDDVSKERLIKLGADDCSIRTVNAQVLADRTRRLVERCQARPEPASNTARYELNAHDARSLAHELKNELHPMRMLVSMLEDPSHPQAELIPLLRTAVDRMCDQVDSTLNGRFESGTGEHADLHRVCTECCNMFTSAYAHRDDLELRFDSTFGPGEAMLAIRPGLLHQILANLVGNAIDALDDAKRKRSSVWLQADVNWSVAVIRVGDNGPGVTPEIRAHMFERDFTTKGERGSGIGLSVVHQMVRNLGGDIDVVSDPGRGTVVTVALPLR